jgi:hypothetical protein
VLGNNKLTCKHFTIAPWFFLTSFKVIAPFIDPVTRNKIKFINLDENKTTTNDLINLDEFIPLKQMEVDLGGEYNFAFDIDTYWNSLLEATGKPYKVIEYK